MAWCGDRWTRPGMDAVEEAIRRVRQHELLVRDVLPDLHRRLAEERQPILFDGRAAPGQRDGQAEARFRRERPPC